jgi:hypothetical protein
VATKIGGIFAELGLDTARFDSGVKSAKRTFADFQRSLHSSVTAMRGVVNSIGSQFTKLASIIISVAGPSALGYLTVQAAQLRVEEGKLARAIGITQAELVGLSLAAKELSGVTGNQTAKALTTMTRRIAEARDGAGEARQIFRSLGIDVKQLGNMSAIQQFYEISDAIAGVKDEGERLRITTKLLESEGARLHTTMAVGSDRLREYEGIARDLGVAVDESVVKQIEIMNTTLGRANLTTQGFGTQMAGALSPILTRIANDFLIMRQETENFSLATSLVDGVTRVVGFLGDTLNLVTLGWAKLWVVAQEASVGLVKLAQMTNPFADYSEEMIIVNDRLERAKELVGEMEAKPKFSANLQNWLEEARAQMQELLKEYEQYQGAVDEGVDVSTRRQMDMYDKMAGAIVEDYQNMGAAVLGVFRDTLKDMMKEYLASGIRNLFSEGGAGAGIGSAVGGFFSSLMGFRDGGQFKVGGAGGVDSQMVAFKASPDETVSVTKPGQGAGGGKAITIIQNNDFSGRGSMDMNQVKGMLKANKDQTIAEVRNLMIRGRMA